MTVDRWNGPKGYLARWERYKARLAALYDAGYQLAQRPAAKNTRGRVTAPSHWQVVHRDTGAVVAHGRRKDDAFNAFDAVTPKEST
jgi:alpha-D-ribose 1-methylphosphonate 5-triphosphate synthase subunit PhnG